MGRFVGRLVVVTVLGISLLASQAVHAAASGSEKTAGLAARQAGTATVYGSPQLLRSAQSGSGGAIVPGFNSQTYGPNDDGSYPCTGPDAGVPGGCTPAPIPLPFPITFYGTAYSSVYLNNNGNLTFGVPLSEYTPESLNQIGAPMIAPFWADVDTRTGPTVTFGYGTVNGHAAFGVNWLDVGCFAENNSVADSFQVLLINRPDLGTGRWQIEFNYGPMAWDSGQASGGDGQCLGGTPARAGYTSGDGPSCELPGSGANGGLLSSNAQTGLSGHDLNSAIPGQYLFDVGSAGVPDGCAGYVALGDSYSAVVGDVSPDLSQSPCFRSSAAWPFALSANYPSAPRLSPSSFFACSGDTTTQILLGKPGEPVSQLQQLKNWTASNGSPSLVTITAGGDDLGFPSIARSCILWIWTSWCSSELNTAIALAKSGLLTGVLEATYDEIRQAAGGSARVAAVGYPFLLPPPSIANALTVSSNCFYLDHADAGTNVVLTLLANFQHALDAAQARAASEADIAFVPLDDVFKGHELCTGDPYISGPLSSGHIHPNSTGQNLIAASVAGQLGYLAGNGSPGQMPEARAAKAPGTGKPGKRAGTGGSGTASATGVAAARAARSRQAAQRPQQAGASAPVITATLPDAIATYPYLGFVAGTGGTAPYSWAVTSGSLPSGLSLDPGTGIVSGTPTAAGTSAFTVTATDSGHPAQTATANESITVGALTPVAVDSTPLANPTAGQPYSATLSAAGGLGPDTWSVTSGSLPAGITLNSASGALTGTPTSAGTSTFTVTATDGSTPAQTGTGTFTLDVAAAATPLTLTAPQLPAGTQGIDYSGLLTSTGGSGPLYWSVTSGNLPDGLSLDPGTGHITGIPTASGTFPFTAEVTDSASGSATESLSITIAASPAPTIDPVTLPDGTQGTAYEDVITASGGVAPYTWSVSSGALPGGLTLDPASGVISGTPTAPGSYSFSVSLADSSTPAAQTATVSASITIAAAPPPPAMTVTDTVTGGIVGDAYQATLIPANGTGPYSFAVTSGALPAGLSLDPNLGIISGTPTTAGTFTATITVTDSSTPTRQTATDSVSITITAPGPLAVSTTSLPDGAVGAPYATPVAVTGGTGADTFAITSGSLPAGLALDPATGIINGTPTTTGASAFTVTVTDSATPTAGTAAASLTLTIDAATPVSITTTSLPDAHQDTPYSQILTGTGGAPPYTWSVSSGSLPDGLSLNSSTGVINGTPTGSGASTFTVQATDSLTPTAQTATESLTLTVIAAAPPDITTTALPEATQGAAYSAALDVGGGTSPFTWSVSSGSLPAGLTLDLGSGEISGTPTGTGPATFTVTVTDSSTPTAQVATRALTLTVAAGPPLAIVTTSLSAANQGVPYEDQVVATGGVQPYTFAVSSGSLPAGLTLDPGSGEISGTPTGTGPATFTVTVTDGSTPAARVVSQSYTITVSGPALTPQAISFTAPAAGTVGGSATLTATGGGSGNPVVFTVDATSGAGVCAVSGTNGTTVHYTGAGSCVIDANQAGNAQYLAAPQVQGTIAVAKAAVRVTLSITGSPVAYGHEKAVTFKATVTANAGTPAGTPAGTVTVAANTAHTSTTLCRATLSRGVATCSPGSATPLAPGTYAVTARYGGSTQYETAVSANGRLIVAKEPTTTRVTTNVSSVPYGREKTLVISATVTARYPGTTPAGKVTFAAGRVILCANKTLTRGKATCSPATGTKLRKGTYSITVTYSGNTDYGTSKSAPKSIRVTAGHATPALLPSLLFGACSPFVDLACPALAL